MMNLIKPIHIVLMIILIFCNACHSTYTGHYNLYKALSEDSKLLDIKNNEIELIIRRIADLFGFQEVQSGSSQSLYYFRNKKSPIMSDYANLEGVDAILSLGYDKTDRFITLRDFTNYRQTKFVEKIQLELEKQLEELIGRNRVKFERQTDLPLP